MNQITRKILSQIYCHDADFVLENQNPKTVTRKMRRIARRHDFMINRYWNNMSFQDSIKGLDVNTRLGLY